MEAVQEQTLQRQLVQPTPKEIDNLCSRYEAALADSDAISAILKEKNALVSSLKLSLVMVTEAFGDRHTEKSKRLLGIHSFAQTTTSVTTETVPAAVNEFKAYLESSHSPTLIGRFFKAHTTYSLVTSPAEVLRGLDLPARVRNKMESLIGRCFEIRAKSPSLKVDVVKPEKR